MINTFILCTEVIIEHIFVGFIFKTWLYLSNNQINIYFPHHAMFNLTHWKTVCMMSLRWLSGWEISRDQGQIYPW